MAHCIFPKNPLLKSITITGDDEFFKTMILEFYEYKKEYDRVPILEAYGLFHSKNLQHILLII